jgi:signal transduction histidine kinase
MKHLTDSLLNLARGELASISLERERIDLARVTEEVAGRFRLQAEEKHVALERNIAEVPPVSGDPVKLSWVVSNLIGNALRYTPEGGRIEVMTGSADDTVRLEVADSGPGIAPELRDYVFERFAQYGDGADKGSAGLGLAIVKDIVVAHGGRIFVTGNAPMGSRFVVQLPASREA